jgi:hypothetical protein
MLTKVRKKPDRPAWIGDDAWKELQEIWKSDEFKKISNQNKVNRDSKRGGAVHTSGRKSHVDVALELVSIKYNLIFFIHHIGLIEMS